MKNEQQISPGTSEVISNGKITLDHKQNAKPNLNRMHDILKLQR